MTTEHSDEEYRTVIHHQQNRLRELETWMALLVMRHGFRTDAGFRYEMTTCEAAALRVLIPRGEPGVGITVDEDGVFVLDVV